MNVSSTLMVLGARLKSMLTECMLAVMGNGVFVAQNARLHQQVHYQVIKYFLFYKLSSDRQMS